MNYPKLEIFDIVELRDGNLAVVLPESENPEEKELGLYTRFYTFFPQIVSVDLYADDLICPSLSSDLDIIKVLKYGHVKAYDTFSYEVYMRMITDIVVRRGLCWNDFKDFNIKDRIKPFGWTWVREECKEVTMADVEEKFGCKVKIVKEK